MGSRTVRHRPAIGLQLPATSRSTELADTLSHRVEPSDRLVGRKRRYSFRLHTRRDLSGPRRGPVDRRHPDGARGDDAHRDDRDHLCRGYEPRQPAHDRARNRRHVHGASSIPVLNGPVR